MTSIAVTLLAVYVILLNIIMFGYIISEKKIDLYDLAVIIFILIPPIILGGIVLAR